MIPRVARWRIPASILLIAVTAPAPRTSFRAPTLGTVSGSSTPFKYPTGIAVDARGAVYLSSAGDSSIVVFAPGASGPAVPIRRIGGSGSDLVSPQGIALDSHGRLVVSVGSHQSRAKGSITVYAANVDGNAAPIRTIAGLHTLLQTPVGIALGRRGRIYVANAKSLGANMGGFYGSLPSDKAVVAFSQDATGTSRPRLPSRTHPLPAGLWTLRSIRRAIWSRSITPR